MRYIKHFMIKTLLEKDLLTTSALYADNKCLINDIYTLNWKKEDVYSEICKYCGIPNCGGEKQLSLRYLCGYLIIFPCFNKYKNHTLIRPFSWSDAIELETIILTEEQCLELNNMGLNLLKVQKYPTPSKEELIQIVQWDTPYHILKNNYPNISINSNVIYAVSHSKKIEKY